MRNSHPLPPEGSGSVLSRGTAVTKSIDLFLFMVHSNDGRVFNPTLRPASLARASYTCPRFSSSTWFTLKSIGERTKKKEEKRSPFPKMIASNASARAMVRVSPTRLVSEVSSL